jgi:hypothetical protein
VYAGPGFYVKPIPSSCFSERGRGWQKRNGKQTVTAKFSTKEMTGKFKT